VDPPGVAAVVEPIDAIMPILQRIQGDMATIKGDIGDMRRVQDDHGRRLDEIVTVLAHHTGRLNEMNGYISFTLNTVSRHTGENEAVRSELDAIKRRLARLEAQT
jgi:chromosome segregation ATPase